MMNSFSLDSIDAAIPVGALSWRALRTILAVWVLYKISRMIYNVSPLHPLHKFPGPRLAAASYAYEFWFDMIKGGRYTREIMRLHDVYGPMVRINPDEIHCNDPNFFDEIYAASNRKRNRSAHHMKHVPTAHMVSHFASLDHDLHRRRRSALNKFFSKTQIMRLEPLTQSLVQKLCDNILREAGKNKPFNVTDAYSCFTSDVISQYTFGEPFGFLDQEGFYPNLRPAIYGSLNMSFIFKFFPFLKGLILAGPWISRFLPTDMAMMVDTFYVNIPNRVKKARIDRKPGAVDEDKPNVFNSLFDSDLPPEEKTTYRLTSEGATLVFAGTETVSWSLSVLTFYLLTKPHILERVTAEVRTFVTDPHNLPSYTSLEALPYLYALLMEGLRLAYGVSMRTGRIAPDEDLIYRGKWAPKDGFAGEVDVDHVVPRGYTASMSAFIMHHDENLYQASHEFIPERWLDENCGRRKGLERNMMTFSRGARVCLGINLAHCELYLGLAALIVRVFPRMQLYDTTRAHVDYEYDMIVPMPANLDGVRTTIL